VKLADALAAGRFSAKRREAIALAVGEANACGYCLAAHTAIGGMVGLKPAEIAAAREAHAADARDDAVLRLARRIVDTRGNVDAAGLRAAREAGLGDEDILETLAVVTLNIFTNYANHIAGTVVDFPAVALPKAA
jgi:AhpD family alkylhydroperoxidase